MDLLPLFGCKNGVVLGVKIQKNIICICIYGKM